jgi:hypothetical protein
MPAWAKRLHLRRAQIVAERGFGNQATSHRPREYRVGDKRLIDRVLRVVYELLE